MISLEAVDNVLSAKIEIFSDGAEFLSNFTLNLPDEDELSLQTLEALEEALQHSHYKISRLVMSLRD